MKLTDSAKTKIQQVMQGQDSDKFFRVKLLAGGCAGFTYQFDVDYFDDDSDVLLDIDDDIQIVIHKAAYGLSMDATIDYVDGISKSEFVVSNPAFEGMCGCGKSVG